MPLTIFDRERKLQVNPAALEKAKKFAPAAPINQIGHMKPLATADDIMPYTPNNDTVYSGALLELADEPIILTAPDIPDRYWFVEVADAHTNNLFYIGTRATGGKSGNHAFDGPNWKGTLPGDVIEHRVPNRLRDVRYSHRRRSTGRRGSAEGQCSAGEVPPDLAEQLGRQEQVRHGSSSRFAQAPGETWPTSKLPLTCSPRILPRRITQPPSSSSVEAASSSVSPSIPPSSTNPPMRGSPERRKWGRRSRSGR
jgi:hypothetical protein